MSFYQYSLCELFVIMLKNKQLLVIENSHLRNSKKKKEKKKRKEKKSSVNCLKK